MKKIQDFTQLFIRHHRTVVIALFVISILAIIVAPLIGTPNFFGITKKDDVTHTISIRPALLDYHSPLWVVLGCWAFVLGTALLTKSHTTAILWSIALPPSAFFLTNYVNTWLEGYELGWSHVIRGDEHYFVNVYNTENMELLTGVLIIMTIACVVIVAARLVKHFTEK